jgi:DNA-binding response OmpR family regulator
MAVDVAHDGHSVTERLAVNDYDVLVLDRDLPGVHGDDICKELAASGARTRILMLTAAGTTADRVEGLLLGADDYLPKPFEYVELVARVQALGRRSQSALPPILEHAGITLDAARQQVHRHGGYVALSRKEFAVLEVLMRAGGATVSAEALLELAWDEHADPFTNVVRVTVSRLRAKLGQPAVIKTLPGVGYQL